MDAESVEMFEQDLKNNLYRIWNRMSSGTYFPPPVRTVGIPKKDGSERRLGIPTVADRIAQTVVKMYESPQMRVGRGGASSMPPQQRNSIEINAPGEWKP